MHYQELDISMKESKAEETQEERESNMEIDIPEQQRDNESDYPKDALDTLDIMTEKTNAQKLNADTVTQTLGSSEFPIDLELAADFEDITEKSCDNSMKTDFDTDGLVEKTDTISQLEHLTTTVHNVDANVCPGPLAEDLFFGNRNSSEQDAGGGNDVDPNNCSDLPANVFPDSGQDVQDNEDGIMEVQASEASHNDQVVDDGKRDTPPKQGQAKNNKGDLATNNCRDCEQNTRDNEDDVMEVQVGETSHHSQEVDDGKCNTPPKQGQAKKDKGGLAANDCRDSGQDVRDNEDDVMEVQDSETFHNLNDQRVNDSGCSTTTKEQPEKSEEGETKKKVRGRPRKKGAAKMVVIKDCNEDKGKKRGRGRPRNESAEEKLEDKEFHAELLRLWPPEGQFDFSKVS